MKTENEHEDVRENERPQESLQELQAGRNQGGRNRGQRNKETTVNPGLAKQGAELSQVRKKDGHINTPS